MQKRIAISACALVMFSVGAGNMLGQQTIGDMIRGGLQTYTPTSADSATAMTNCGVTEQQLRDEGYTEQYVFKGEEEIISVEYCQNGSVKTDNRLRLVAADSVGFLKPADRTQVAFTTACKNRGVLKTPPPIPPTPVAPPVAVTPPPTVEVPPAETPPEPPVTTFQIRRPFFVGCEEEEVRFCAREHNFFVKATAVQVACHPVRTAIILTAACVIAGEGLTWGPCRGIHYLFTGKEVEKAATAVIHK
jgi:hypothetical protein